MFWNKLTQGEIQMHRIVRRFLVLTLMAAISTMVVMIAHAALVCKAKEPGIVIKKGKSSEFYTLMDKIS